MVADITTLLALLGSSRRLDAEPGQLQLPDGAKEETVSSLEGHHRAHRIGPAAGRVAERAPWHTLF